MKALTGFALASLFVLTSCASMQQAWVDQNCQRESAYEKGMNDARSGSPMMSAQYSGNCPAETRELVLTGYREGYTSGLGSLQQTGASAPPALINVNIGGSPDGGINPRAWYCKTKAFTDEFEAFGPTQLEAVQLVTNQCRAKYDPMFCKTSSCRLNQ